MDKHKVPGAVMGLEWYVNSGSDDGTGVFWQSPSFHPIHGVGGGSLDSSINRE